WCPREVARLKAAPLPRTSPARSSASFASAVLHRPGRGPWARQCRTRERGAVTSRNDQTTPTLGGADLTLGTPGRPRQGVAAPASPPKGQLRKRRPWCRGAGFGTRTPLAEAPIEDVLGEAVAHHLDGSSRDHPAAHPSSEVLQRELGGVPR